MMSSLDHPTANLEDAFSSNFPNYVPQASPDYIPTSPGKTYSSASNSFGIVPLTSPTLSLFPDDPYNESLKLSIWKKAQAATMAQRCLKILTDTAPPGPPAVKTVNFKEYYHCQPSTSMVRKDSILFAGLNELKSVFSNDDRAIPRITVAMSKQGPTTYNTLLEAVIKGLLEALKEMLLCSKLKLLEKAIKHSPKLRITIISPVQCRYQTTTKESLTTEELSTTIPATTIATPTIVTIIVDNRTEDKKLVEPS
ncbi:hypothetical protein Tco_0317238 [Tanacetum coccineum]